MIDSVKHKRNSEFHWISKVRLKFFLNLYFWPFKERNVFPFFALIMIDCHKKKGQLHTTYLDTIQLSRLHSRPFASTWRAHITSLQTLPRLSIEQFLTHLTVTASRIVLTIDAHSPSPKGAWVGICIEGLIINAAIGMIITLAFDAGVGVIPVTS